MTHSPSSSGARRPVTVVLVVVAAAMLMAIVVFPSLLPGPGGPSPDPQETAEPAGAAGAASSLTAEQRQRRDEGFAEAEALMRENRFDEALTRYEDLLSIVPEDGELHQRRGVLLTILQRPAEAEAAYREAVRVAPDSAAAHRGLGQRLRVDGRRPEAIQHLARAVQLEPSNWRNQFDLAATLFEDGQVRASLEPLARAAELTPDPRVHDLHGRARAATGDFPGAAESFRRVTAADPESPNGWTNLGLMLLRTGEIAEARRSFRTALEQDPTFERALVELQRLDG